MHGYEVQWCSNLPMIEGTTDADIDKAEYTMRDFDTQAEAVALAKQIIIDRLDAFGAVIVTEFQMEEYEPGIPAWHREYVSDPIEISSKDCYPFSCHICGNAFSKEDILQDHWQRKHAHLGIPFRLTTPNT